MPSYLICTGWSDWSRSWGKSWICRLRSTIRAHPIAQLHCLRRLKITGRPIPIIRQPQMTTPLTRPPVGPASCQWKGRLLCLLTFKSSDPLPNSNDWRVCSQTAQCAIYSHPLPRTISTSKKANRIYLTLKYVFSHQELSIVSCLHLAILSSFFLGGGGRV